MVCREGRGEILGWTATRKGAGTRSFFHGVWLEGETRRPGHSQYLFNVNSHSVRWMLSTIGKDEGSNGVFPFFCLSRHVGSVVMCTCPDAFRNRPGISSPFGQSMHIGCLVSHLGNHQVFSMQWLAPLPLCLNNGLDARGKQAYRSHQHIALASSIMTCRDRYQSGKCKGYRPSNAPSWINDHVCRRELKR